MSLAPIFRIFYGQPTPTDSWICRWGCVQGLWLAAGTLCTWHKPQVPMPGKERAQIWRQAAQHWTFIGLLITDCNCLAITVHIVQPACLQMVQGACYHESVPYLVMPSQRFCHTILHLTMAMAMVAWWQRMQLLSTTNILIGMPPGLAGVTTVI